MGSLIYPWGPYKSEKDLEKKAQEGVPEGLPSDFALTWFNDSYRNAQLELEAISDLLKTLKDVHDSDPENVDRARRMDEIHGRINEILTETPWEEF